MTFHTSSGTRMERVGADIANAALALIGLCVAYLIVITFTARSPLSKLEIAVREPVVVGEWLLVDMDYCKTANEIAHEIRWNLIDGVTILLTPTIGSLPVGCRTTTIALEPVKQMVAGRYKLQVMLVYNPLPWRTIYHAADSQYFQVRNRQ